MGRHGRLHPSYHDEWLARASVVSVRRRVLEVWKDFPQVDEELERALDVEGKSSRCYDAEMIGRRMVIVYTNVKFYGYLYITFFDIRQLRSVMHEVFLYITIPSTIVSSDP